MKQTNSTTTTTKTKPQTLTEVTEIDWGLAPGLGHEVILALLTAVTPEGQLMLRTESGPTFCTGFLGIALLGHPPGEWALYPPWEEWGLGEESPGSFAGVGWDQVQVPYFLSVSIQKERWRSHNMLACSDVCTSRLSSPNRQRVLCTLTLPPSPYLSSLVYGFSNSKSILKASGHMLWKYSWAMGNVSTWHSFLGTTWLKVH